MIIKILVFDVLSQKLKFLLFNLVDWLIWFLLEVEEFVLFVCLWNNSITKWGFCVTSGICALSFLLISFSFFVSLPQKFFHDKLTLRNNHAYIMRIILDISNDCQ